MLDHEFTGDVINVDFSKIVKITRKVRKNYTTGLRQIVFVPFIYIYICMYTLKEKYMGVRKISLSSNKPYTLFDKYL